jgi:hypothetical protein
VCVLILYIISSHPDRAGDEYIEERRLSSHPDRAGDEYIEERRLSSHPDRALFLIPTTRIPLTFPSTHNIRCP